jgi:DNA-binding GntR family transcriptional regulator
VASRSAASRRDAIGSPADGGGLDGQGSKSDQVYRWLRNEVATGRLRPTARVNADRISRDLEVSKIPVREAIARLANEGALQVVANVGALVTPLSWQELRDIQQARLVLEPPAAETAAVRRPDRSALAPLRANIAEMRRWARSGVGDPSALTRGFHLALIGLSGNAVLTSLLDVVLHRVSRYRMVVGHSAASARANANEHTQIVDALADGDPVETRRLLVEHLTSDHSVGADAREIDPGLFVDSDAQAAPGSDFRY